MLAAADNHEDDGDEYHAQNDDHHNGDKLFHLHNLQTLNLRLFSAIFLFVLSLRVFLSLWRSSGTCVGGVQAGMLCGQKKVSLSSLDLTAHFSCSSCPNIFFNIASMFCLLYTFLGLPLFFFPFSRVAGFEGTEPERICKLDNVTVALIVLTNSQILLLDKQTCLL